MSMFEVRILCRRLSSPKLINDLDDRIIAFDHSSIPGNNIDNKKKKERWTKHMRL